ncbi:MAG TPA: hypothetical protein VIL22_09950 [Paenibacillaceae bacterium]
MTTTATVKTFDDALELVNEVGILPFSPYFPEHPSLWTVTDQSKWHTGTPCDPWLWRDRFGQEGLAAYGRFLGDKPFLVSREIFPLFRAALKGLKPALPAALEERLRLIREIIRNQEGVSVKDLRKLSGMVEKEDKNPFDKILIHLQKTGEVLICGIADRLTASGAKDGWNSTCYMTVDHWMQRHGIADDPSVPADEAASRLLAWCAERWTPPAVQFFRKRITPSTN